MPEAAFVMSAGQPRALRELVALVRYELAQQAVPSGLHLDGFPPPTPQRVYVLVDPADYVRREGEAALPEDAVLRRTVFLCAGPAPAAESDPQVALLQRAGAVFALEPGAVAGLERLGVRARLLRIGYSRSLDAFDADRERPVDVVFLAEHSRRRTRYLNRAARVLARHECVLQVVPSEPVAPEVESLPDDGARALLASAKVLINLHRDGDTQLEWRRALEAVHAGAVLVTEHASGLAPLVAGEHLLVAAPDAVPFVAEVLLRDAARLAALRAAAYERLSAWMPSALPVSVLRAALVELVGEPVPPAPSLGSVTTADRPSAEPPAPAPGTPGAAAGGETEPAPVEVLHDTPAWSELESPAVSVVATLTAGGGAVVGTLDSLVPGRLPGVELVIVAGTDAGDGDVARNWCAEHPGVAAQVVSCPAGGRGAARNAGICLARAPLCLVLEPGQELYPRCLEVLAAALHADPDAAFAYAITEVTGAPDAFADAGGDYLLSHLPWDPARLRAGNFIHAPVLVRRDVVLQAGGFATDPALAGFEDYDLWCRLAERGRRGALVPQVLARRAESGSSEALATMHPAPGPATALLTRRAPRLLSGAF